MKAAAQSQGPRRGRKPAYLLALEDKLAGYMSGEQIVRVRRAYEVGALAHKGQTRRSGEPYITHPVAVAGILAELGMDAETLDRAFEQFYRAEDARLMVPDGSGIGLYAAAGLMRAMGGSMAAASRKDAGTTITLRLPSEPAVAEPDPPPVPMTH